jgi:hypothetical protein
LWSPDYRRVGFSNAAGGLVAEELAALRALARRAQHAVQRAETDDL